MKKIRVLNIHTLPVISGSGLAVCLMMTGLDKDRYEVEFACASGGPLIDKVSQAGIKVFRLRNLVQPIRPVSDILALIEMIFLIIRRRYTIVHTHNSKAGIIGRVAAKISGVPVIVHTIHGFAFHDFEKPFKKRIFIWIERLAALFTDRLFVISIPLREWGLKVGIGGPEKYALNYDGIEVEKFAKEFDQVKIRGEFGISQDDKVVGMVAKLWEGKGHKYLLEAAVDIVKIIPNVKFMLVGDGYLKEYLTEYVGKLGIFDYVIFTGFREDIPEITSIFDIACLPSLFEGMGRVLLEAQISAKPIVATRVGGIVELVKDNETGFLVRPADVNGLKEAIIRLLEDGALAKKMGEAGRQHLDEKFSSARMVENIDKAYSELLKQKRLLK